ncbi:MAG: nuclear transport factor 2 family protein [Proteobacteria bacterium]|nr:nuclear transport factor 2 family protein [Pseudomonadota bacterium]HQR03570.1 nuclear transport factor 2 family protein [Rhodocyclaceae bacterium]
MNDVDYYKDSPHPAQQASFLSMRNVMAKNKATWLTLFASDAVLQDPVGKSPLDPSGLGHRGEAIGRFWDTAIASVVNIRVRESYPAADECANLCTVTQPLPNGKTADASFIVVYRVNAEGKVVSLRAFWDYDATMARMQAQMAS